MTEHFYIVCDCAFWQSTLHLCWLCVLTEHFTLLVTVFWLNTLHCWWLCVLTEHFTLLVTVCFDRKLYIAGDCVFWQNTLHCWWLCFDRTLYIAANCVFWQNTLHCWWLCVLTEHFTLLVTVCFDRTLYIAGNCVFWQNTYIAGICVFCSVVRLCWWSWSSPRRAMSSRTSAWERKSLVCHKMTKLCRDWLWRERWRHPTAFLRKILKIKCALCYKSSIIASSGCTREFSKVATSE